MNKIMKSFTAVIMTALAMALTACGGGGGGGGTTPPPPASPTASITSIVPANGAVNVKTDANIVITQAITNATSVDATHLLLSCNSVAKAFTTGTTLTATTSVSTLTPTLPFALGDICSISGDITTSGTAGTTPAVTHVNQSFTLVNKLTYAEKVYASWTNRNLYSVNKAVVGVVTTYTVAKVINTTQYGSGGNDLFNCLLATYALPNGKVLALCKDVIGLKYHLFYINPETDKLYEYGDAVPVDLSYTLSADQSTVTSQGVKWGDAAPADPLHPTWGAHAQVAGGWYFTLAVSGWILEFQDNANVVSIVKSGTFATDGTVRLLVSYSN
jgi:hypothetical protein